MKGATWNVNSIGMRLDHVKIWLQQNKPDFLFLQELKTVEENFPFEEFKQIGYESFVYGQKAFNGVAILIKQELAKDKKVDQIQKGMPTFPTDEQARYISLDISDLKLICIYAPNGNPVDTEKFSYKQEWLRQLTSYLQKLLELDQKFLIGGDFNIIPSPEDAANPKAWEGDALFLPQSRDHYFTLLNMGLTDALRCLNPDKKDLYTFWDYQRGAWQRNDGIRIDHFLLSPQIAEKLKSCSIDQYERAKEKPSDHVPLIMILDL